MLILSLLSTFISFTIFLCGLWSFVSSYKHLLSVLLSLEFIILGIFLGDSDLFNISWFSGLFYIFF